MNVPELVHSLLEKVDRLSTEVKASRLLSAINAVHRPLVALEQKCAEEGFELSQEDIALIRNAQYFTSSEFLHGHDESSYEGGCPEPLELKDFPFKVARGPGGWGTASQVFTVRGANYLQDEVKVITLFRLLSW